jgi:hypothetical protein
MNLSDNPPRIPIRGDIVFFEGAAHVALATGARDGMRRSKVLSFWPPPDVVPYTAGTLDKGEGDDHRRACGLHILREHEARGHVRDSALVSLAKKGGVTPSSPFHVPTCVWCGRERRRVASFRPRRARLPMAPPLPG